MKPVVNKNKIRYLLMFLMLIMLVTACSQQKQIEITDFTHYSAYDNPEILEEQGCLDYDSVTFSDGSYAVKHWKSAPQNSLIRYVDQDGRLIATVSAASETYTQRLIYGYDGNGRLKYLLRFEYMLEPDFHDDTTESAYLLFRLAIDSIDFRHPDLKRHTLSEIIYGNDGVAREMTEQQSGKSIKAPDGYKLEVSVIPCENFWESDLSGGRFLLKADIVPIADTMGDYTVKRFEDFTLIAEEHYKDGVLQTSLQFEEESFSVSH